MSKQLNKAFWFFAVFLLVPLVAHAASVTMTASDALGNSSFTNASNWSNAALPSSANDYYTSTFGIRTPGDANNYTFGGKSLTLQPGTTTGYSLIYKGTATANTYTIKNLTNNGGFIRSGAGSGNSCIIAGNMVVAGNSTIQADQSAFVISGNLSGAGVLTNLNPAPQTYGTVTYSGTNSAFGGELLLGANAIVIFANSNSAPGNPAAPNSGQITLGAGSTLEDLAGVALRGANGGMTLAGNATINVSGSNIATTVAVPVTGGSVNLAKTGSGTLYLDGTDACTGTTTVSAGTLAGGGSLSGPVVVAATASLGAGDGGTTVGTLTINNNLTLQGNVALRISKTGGTPTNDEISVSGTVSYAGVLTITNVTSDGTPLVAGDVFQLFNVTGAASGSFNTSIAGSPGAGLAYAFNPTNGVLSVVTTASLAAVLVHRYSFFSEPNGSLMATDTIAGANGTLAGGAVITGGKLVLNGSGGYANLPGGVLNGYPVVTIEAWADFGSLPVNCYLFSFGNTDVSGSGADYIFCAPQAARITLSGADPGNTSGAEQNASCSGWSGLTNLHVVAIYDPPAGYMAIYTNGVLAGVNNTITTPLTSVSNVLSYIGRSLYTSDPYAPLNVSEFRIWNGALSTQQIAVDAATGPSQIITDPGPIQAMHLILNNQMTAGHVYSFEPGGTATATANLQAHGSTQQALVTADFTNVLGVNLLSYGLPTLTSANTKVLTVTASGVVTAIAPGTTFITATYGTLDALQSVTAVFATNTFIFDSFGDGFWSIINQGNGNALVAGASGSTQATLVTNSTPQLYEMLFNIQSNNFRIRQESSWLCLGAISGIKSPGTPVTTVNYTGTGSQQWNLVDAGGGYFRIASAATNLVLQTDNGSPASVTLAQSNASPYQLWQFVYQAHYPKKGIAGYEGDYAPFELNWAYNYDDHTSVNLPAAVGFGPMIHDASWEPLSDVQSRSAGWRTQAAPGYLMTYNEPDNASQANMLTNQVAGLWPSLLALNVPLVGPGTQNIEDAWENNYYSLMTQNSYRVDYSAVHDYVPPNASSLISNCRSVYNAYGRPVWLTEFSPVDWNGNQGWTEDDDYNFLAEFMWQAEDQDWFKRYAIFPFSGSNTLPPWQSTTVGYRGNYFLADGATLAPYGELYATWDADRALHGRVPYFLHNLASSFRLAATNGISTPQGSSIYIRNANDEWALLAAPTTNHWYIISLNDGRRLSDIGGNMGLQPVGTTGTTVEWTFTGPDSSGYYFIGNPAGGHNLNAAGTDPAITFNTTTSSTQNNNTRWRLVKPYQAVTINTNYPVPGTPVATPGDGVVTLGWPGGTALYYNVYRGTGSGGPYLRWASALKSGSFQDGSVADGVPYYYVVTAMDILGEESAYSAEAAALPTSLAATNLTFALTGGNNLQLSWPADHTGWTLQVQTNDLDTGLSTNWQNVAGSAVTNQVLISADPANAATFYRLMHP